MRNLLTLIALLSGLNSSTYASLGENKFLLGSYAAHTRIECELPQNSVIENVYKTDNGNYISCNNVDSFNETLSEVTALVPDGPEVSLYVEKRNSNASFDMGRIIRIPIQMVFNGKYGNFYHGSYMGVHTVLAHEYGHAIFSERIKKYDFYKDIQELAHRSSSYELAIQDAYAKGNPNNIVEFYRQQIKSLFEKRKNDKQFQKVRKITGAYNEFFADVVAVVAKNDKSAVMMALYYDEMNDQQYQMVQARQFANNSLDMQGSYMNVVHTKFAPVRRFVGENLWPTNSDEAKTLIDKTFEAVVIEIQKQLKKEQMDSSRELNKSLIETLKKLYNIENSKE